jgi:hypothetical protein
MTLNFSQSSVSFSLKGMIPSCFLVAIFATLGLVSLKRVVAASEEKALRLRSLEIVDSAGVARMRLAAPVPDPVTDGKSSPRRSPQAGIQLNDAKGNEIGGLGMLDDGSTILCFDTHSSEATCMYVLPSGERGFSVSDDHGKDRALMALNADKTVSISLMDSQGKTKAVVRLGKDGAPEIQLTTSDGKMLWTTPQPEKAK